MTKKPNQPSSSAPPQTGSATCGMASPASRIHTAATSTTPSQLAADLVGVVTAFILRSMTLAKAKAKPDEIYHAIVLLTSTIGFPAASAALSWARDVIEKQ